MDPGKELAYVVAFYLSKFNSVALQNLGFKTDKQAFTEFGERLKVLPSYIRFRRDEFDVIHPHRKGWVNRTHSKRTLATINALSNIDERSFSIIIKDILKSNIEDLDAYNLSQLLSIYSYPKASKDRSQLIYFPRSVTGKKAEEYFISWIASSENELLPDCQLNDCRDLGCGYDFEISNEKVKYIVEIKGASEVEEYGVMFTEKEWLMANKYQDEYYLIIINDLNNSPKINIIKNPGRNLNPQERIITTIQIVYNVSSKQLSSLLE